MSYPSSYWRPHFVVEKVYYESLGECMYNTGIHEVYYEEGYPTSWTANSCSVQSSDEDMNESIDQSYKLLKIYEYAKENIVYFVCKDDNGKEYLKALHPSKAINYDEKTDELTFDYTEEDSDDTSDIALDIEESVIEKLNNLGIDPKTTQGSEEFYNILYEALRKSIDEWVSQDDELEDCEKQRLKDKLVNNIQNNQDLE